MFSGSISVVLLVVFVSQGQSTTTMSPRETSSAVSRSITTATTTTTSTTTPTTKTTQGQTTTPVIPSATSSVVSQNSSVTIPPPTSTAITTPTTTPTATPLISQSTTTMSPRETSSAVSRSITTTTTTTTSTTTRTTKTTQGQSSSAVAPNATSSVVLQSSTVTVANGPPSNNSSITATTAPLLTKTCVMLGVTIDLAWDEDYGKESSETYKNVSKEYCSALENLFEKHQNVKASDVTFKDKDGKVFADAKLCLVFKIDLVLLSIKVTFRAKVESGKLSVNLKVLIDSPVFKALEVSYKNYKAKEGECCKCDGAAGAFEIVAECVPNSKEFSCNGLEKTKTMETDDCVTYCSSTAALTVSSLILAIGILLSSSFQ